MNYPKPMEAKPSEAGLGYARSNISRLSQSQGFRSRTSNAGRPSTTGLHRMSLLQRPLFDVSKMNYYTLEPEDPHIPQINQISPQNEMYLEDFLDQAKTSDEELYEQFPPHLTPLMNEDQYWGCFYNFPELYEDSFSPVVNVRRLDAVPELVGGVLTRDMIAACLTYLKRTPILGDFVFIKLDVSSKHLMNIEVLQHYKYLVYLDLSSNFLTELTVLSHLPYLQFLTVSFNRLSTVLEYETPQWFLTEVHYKFNSVKRIRDLTLFWSITILDLSHNNIKTITGLDNLNYLRRLDLSFNHIQRLENLNHLRLLWLDVSYNNISTFEYGPNAGLWTLLHLEYLNLNENKLTSMKMFSGCGRLRELHARNNRLSMLLELAVYMKQLKRLVILDLRENPIWSTPGYKDVVMNTFPVLLSLDSIDLDPVEQRLLKMDMSPDVSAFSTRRLLRLLYIEQLSRARVSPYIPPADTTEVPIVILVGYEAVGKGTLARRLAQECNSHIELAQLHTTSRCHYPGHYIEVSRSNFDNMLLAGDLLTYYEMDGESYGLSREEAFIKGGKVKVVAMDLISALMVKLRGRNPYMILATCTDKNAVYARQSMRKSHRMDKQLRIATNMEQPMEKSTLQVLISGRILVTGILNEILLSFPEDKEQSEFIMESECSLLMDSDARKAVQDYAMGVNLFTLLNSSTTSLEEVCNRAYKDSQNDAGSLCSLFKESQTTDEYQTSDVRDGSYQKSTDKGMSKGSSTNVSRPKSYIVHNVDSAKSSKSVTFTSNENTADTSANVPKELTGLLIEPIPSDDKERKLKPPLQSISTKIPGLAAQAQAYCKHRESATSADDLDLWLNFLTETGLLGTSDTYMEQSEPPQHRDTTKFDDPDAILKQLAYYHMLPNQATSTTIRDDYENIHRECPGLFWDAVSMDDPDEAFIKVKRIIKDIVRSQPNLKPMFDIEFSDMDNELPFIKTKLAKLSNLISPTRLYF